MPNALDFGGSPPAPLPGYGSSAPSQPMNALAMGGAAPQGGGGLPPSSPLAALAGAANASSRPQQPPSPSHAQAVAALRPFPAIHAVLGSIMRDPALGKSDM